MHLKAYGGNGGGGGSSMGNLEHRRHRKKVEHLLLPTSLLRKDNQGFAECIAKHEITS